MAKLKNRHKEFIIKQLATFENSTDIIQKVQDRYNINVSLSQIAYYSPENSQGGRELAQKWIHLFNSTRDEYLSKTSKIPIAQKAYRMNQLQKIYDLYMKRKDYEAAQDVLEQAAKEMGGAYGQPISVDNSTNNFYQQVNQKIMQLNEG